MRTFTTLLSGFMLVSARNCQAYELNDKLAVNAVLAGAYQYLDADGDKGTGRGAVPFQTELAYAPGQNDLFAVKFGFAAGNALNDQTGFILAPWAADLEDNVKDINGRNREDEELVVKVINKVETEAHTSGLTNRVQEYLKEIKSGN